MTSPLRLLGPRHRLLAPAPVYPALMAMALACAGAGCIVDPGGETDEPLDGADTDSAFAAAPEYPIPGPADGAVADTAGDSEVASEPSDEPVVAGCSVSPFHDGRSSPMPWVVAAAGLLAIRRRRR